MANSLNREIVAGEIVIVRQDWLNPQFRHDPRFETNGYGFGCHSFTSGTSLGGRWLIDGENGTIDSYAIDAEATRRFQSGEEKWPKEAQSGHNSPG